MVAVFVVKWNMSHVQYHVYTVGKYSIEWKGTGTRMQRSRVALTSLHTTVSNSLSPLYDDFEVIEHKKPTSLVFPNILQ